MSSIPCTWGFKRVTWNYSERGHGKGAPDGVGTPKRKADMQVLGGRDLQNPRKCVNICKRLLKNFMVIWIEEEEVSVMDEMLPPSVRPVTGISSMHQLLSFGPGEIFYRALSCFCKYPDMCACHKPTHHQFDNNSPAEVLCSQPSDSHHPNQAKVHSFLKPRQISPIKMMMRNTEGQFVILNIGLFL